MTNRYSKTIGYSPLVNVDYEKMLQIIQINKIIIDEYYESKENDTILVAGAGLGQEALIINKEFNLKTFGVDLHIEQHDVSSVSQEIVFQRQDLTSLAFKKNAFALVYSYHVLEHVADHMSMLREIYRVLKPGGVLFIGFPNKNRLISYIGTSQKVSNLDRLKWNLNDYKYKLSGKFENKFGAHAGFTEKEFIKDASNFFDTIYPVRDKYMLVKYPFYHKIIRYLIKTKLEEIVFPSNYYICTKKASTE
jgi:ubiquinone/menaquinone biosynthesis C-methylase UbiE